MTAMAPKKSKTATEPDVLDYRHEDTKERISSPFPERKMIFVGFAFFHLPTLNFN